MEMAEKIREKPKLTPYILRAIITFIFLGAIIFFLGPGTALIFGSLWALIPAGLTILLIFIRTYLEDKTLLNELDGYREYVLKVKYRLIPGIW